MNKSLSVEDSQPVLPMVNRIYSPTTYNRPRVVQRALKMLECELRETAVLTSSPAVRDYYLRLWLGDRPHEVFAVVFLDAQHQVIDTVELFRGTLTQTTVYPREVVIESLARNAAAVEIAP